MTKVWHSTLKMLECTSGVDCKGYVGAFYGVPKEISDKVMSYMDDLQKAMYVAFNEIYGGLLASA